MAKNIYFRQGVYGDKLHDSIRKKLGDIDAPFLKRKNPTLVSSIYESSLHGANSLHYQHKAIDIKEPFDSAIKDMIFYELKHSLGKDYDVVWHKNSHYHIEFDPNR